MLNEQEEIILQKILAGEGSSVEISRMQELMKNPEFAKALDVEKKISLALSNDAKILSKTSFDPSFLQKHLAARPSATEQILTSLGSAKIFLNGLAVVIGAVALFWLCRTLFYSEEKAVSSTVQTTSEAPDHINSDQMDSNVPKQIDHHAESVDTNENMQRNLRMVQKQKNPQQINQNEKPPKQKEIPVIVNDSVDIPIHINQ